MCRVNRDAVCGLYEMSDDMRARGHAAEWMNYVPVAGADAAAARAKEFGGAVIEEAWDVLDIGHGSIAMVRDPRGALFTMFAREVDA